MNTKSETKTVVEPEIFWRIVGYAVVAGLIVKMLLA